MGSTEAAQAFFDDSQHWKLARQKHDNTRQTLGRLFRELDRPMWHGEIWLHNSSVSFLKCSFWSEVESVERFFGSIVHKLPKNCVLRLAVLTEH